MSALVDRVVRDLAETTGLDQTLFVEAGAGTGKTSLLVKRIVNLVLDAGVSLRSIAAITFTEAAAAELSSRIRAEFERAHTAAFDDGDAERAERCQQAVDDSDLAAISTLHGFANRILGEFSVAAGLPPQVRVLDEVASQLAHEARWQRFVDRLFDDPAHEALLTAANALGIQLDERFPRDRTMRDVAVEFNQNWDRLDEIRAEAGLAPPPVDLVGFEQAITAVEAWIPECQDPNDKLLAHLLQVVPEMRAVATIENPVSQLRRLAAVRKKGWNKTGYGKKDAWNGQAATVRESIQAVNEAVAEAIDPITDRVLLSLAGLIADEVVAAAHTRRAEGGLEFHDLLVLARDLLRTNPEARRALHERYTHLLLDEFQDTDPIQIELAVLIATDEPEVTGRTWSELSVPAGRLFFVGDPKQSIYRFRRADIGLFLAARDRFAGPAGALQLTTNFRTVEPIVDWVNAMFAHFMPAEVAETQPRYEPLHAFRGDRFEPERHRPILLGGPHPDPKIRSADLRAVEAGDVVAAVQAILNRPDEFMVEKPDRIGRHIRRPARLEDITILLPTRTSLPFLRSALDAAAIRYRIATGTLVYDTQQVVDALAALRAIDDPSDTLSLITALRSPLYACSDVDLYSWRQAGGHWDHRRAVPDAVPADDRVRAAMDHLGGLWQQRWFLTPSAMLERLLRERRAAMLAFGSSRPTDVWRRLRFLVDQARAFEESNPGGLRAFCDWAALQSGEMARVHEPLLPETDETALSIQTIHGSKGLEFPITILSGMTTRMTAAPRGVSVLWGDVGPPEISIRSGVSTMRHEPRADLEAAMDTYERMRLAYVAATRARDHLIVSCHHKGKPESSYGGLFHQACVELEAEGLAQRLESGEGGDGPVGVEPRSDQLGLVLDSRETWVARRQGLLAGAGRPRVLSATGVARAAAQAPTADGIDFDQDDDHADADDVAVAGAPGAVRERRRGRTGSAIGTAVHAVLQHLDFAAVAGIGGVEGGADQVDRGDRGVDEMIAEMVDEMARAEGIGAARSTVAALVGAALGSKAVALAVEHPHHKELFVAAPVGDRVIEGYVDLLVETPGGLVVVDYKTDSVRSEADIDAKLATYELQAAAYAVALEAATGLDVVECRFVFLRSAGAVERSVADLAGAKARVQATVAGRAVDI